MDDSTRTEILRKAIDDILDVVDNPGTDPLGTIKLLADDAGELVDEPQPALSARQE